jgi:hypothetical protein
MLGTQLERPAERVAGRFLINWTLNLIRERTTDCPPQERAASTTASNKEDFVEASPSRVLRDGEGMSLFKLSTALLLAQSQ